MADNLAEALQRITKTSDEVYAKICSVIKINQSEKTVDVKPIDDTAEIYNVRLQPDSQAGGLVLIPKVDSVVLVVFINKSSAVVVNTSEIEKLSVVIKSCQFEIDETGFLLKKENETLKILMADLIKAIKGLKFTTNMGPTIELINIDDFTSVEKRFNQFLK